MISRSERSVFDIRSRLPNLVLSSRFRFPLAIAAVVLGALIAINVRPVVGTQATIALLALPLALPVALAKSATACGMNALATFARPDRSAGQRLSAAYAYALTATVTAAAIGLLASIAGGLVGAARFLPVVAIIALYFGLRELGFIRLGSPVRSSMWQVPARWTHRPLFGPVVWGFFLGSGLSTQMPFPSFYALLAVVTVLPWPLGAGLMAIYGATRSIPGIGASISRRWAGTPDVIVMLRLRVAGHAASGIACLGLAGVLGSLVWQQR